MSAWGVLSATAMFYSATCIVLYMHPCSRLNYHIASMRCALCHLHVTLKWAMRVINGLPWQPAYDIAYSSTGTPSWMRTTVVDGDKFLAVRCLSLRLHWSKNTILNLPHLYWHPHWGWSHRYFIGIFCFIKLESLGYMWCCLLNPVFSHFRRTLTCDGRTDGRTHDDSKYRASIASHG